MRNSNIFPLSGLTLYRSLLQVFEDKPGRGSPDTGSPLYSTTAERTLLVKSPVRDGDSGYFMVSNRPIRDGDLGYFLVSDRPVGIGDPGYLMVSNRPIRDRGLGILYGKR